jgi:hypothetical protein
VGTHAAEVAKETFLPSDYNNHGDITSWLPQIHHTLTTKPATGPYLSQLKAIHGIKNIFLFFSQSIFS